MKTHTICKTKGGRKVTFTSPFFKLLEASDPRAINLFISSFLDNLKGVLGERNVFIDYKQNQKLSQIFDQKKYEMVTHLRYCQLEMWLTYGIRSTYKMPQDPEKQLESIKTFYDMIDMYTEELFLREEILK